jgi:midasin
VSIAQAVTRGSWLLVEDLNLAPPEVLAALVPLLEGRALHLSHRSQVITAAPGFQFIASVTTAPGASLRRAIPTSVFSSPTYGGLRQS